MAENKMKEVAELLGIEMDKYFKIDGFRNSLFKITNNGFISSDGWRDGVLDGLLTRRIEGTKHRAIEGYCNPPKFFKFPQYYEVTL